MTADKYIHANALPFVLLYLFDKGFQNKSECIAAQGFSHSFDSNDFRVTKVCVSLEQVAFEKERVEHTGTDGTMPLTKSLAKFVFEGV